MSPTSSSETMRAILIKDGKGPIEHLHLGTAPKPAPEPRQVLVQVKAFGLNRMDISQRQGLYPPPPGASTLLGVEFSGLVLQLGSEVQGIAVGDAVIGLAGGGAYAEYIAAPAANVVKKPAHLSWTEAASIPENFLTAYQALLLVAELKAGDHVLIHAGASGVGVAAIQLARYFGAATVTATASTAEKLSWLLSLPAGPTHVANYRTADFAATVQDATGGHGADVVVDMVGQSHWHANVRSMALDGRMTILSSLSGSEVAKVDLGPILYKRLRIQGSTLRSRPLEYQAALVARFAETLPDFSGSDGAGKLRTYIHKVYPWTEIQAATREMEANANSGKIVVEVRD